MLLKLCTVYHTLVNCHRFYSHKIILKLLIVRHKGVKADAASQEMIK